MACRREPSATRGTRCAVATHSLRRAPRHGYVSRTEVTGTAHGPSRKGALAQRQLRRHAAADGSSAEGQPSLEDPRADAGHYSQNADAGRSTLDAEDPVRDVLRNPFCRLQISFVRDVSERPSRLIKMKITAWWRAVGLSICQKKFEADKMDCVERLERDLPRPTYFGQRR